LENGIHTSMLMSESAVGVKVAATRQNAGKVGEDLTVGRGVGARGDRLRGGDRGIRQAQAGEARTCRGGCRGYPDANKRGRQHYGQKSRTE
jgi:hypothetical protein